MQVKIIITYILLDFKCYKHIEPLRNSKSKKKPQGPYILALRVTQLLTTKSTTF